jgi:hypothetical protein
MPHSFCIRRTGFRSPSLRRWALVLAATSATALAAAPAASASFSLGSPTSYGVGEFPQSVAIGDLNADGRPDLAAANWLSGGVSVLLANPGGGFAPAVTYPAGRGPDSVAVGDLNADGRLDMAVANLNSDDVSVLLADPAGGFLPATSYVAGDVPISVAIGDLNADGRPDLAVSNTRSSDVSVLLGKPGGSFAAATNYPVGSRPEQIAIADLNADGRSDLAVATEEGVSVRLANASGGLDAVTTYGAGRFPTSLAIGDLNADGRPDLAVAIADQTTSSDLPDDVSVLLAKPGGGFAAPAHYTTGYRPYALAIGDLNADGRPDLAVANYGSNGLSVLLADGRGGFAEAITYPTTRPWSVAIGDLNADGRPDVALADSDSGSVSVMPNTSTPSAEASPGALAFARQRVGTASRSQTITVTNDGDAPLDVAGLSLIGPDADEFKVSGDGCTGERIAVGDTCEIGVRFAPIAKGQATATLLVTSNDPASPTTVALSGTGIPPHHHHRSHSGPPATEIPPAEPGQAEPADPPNPSAVVGCKRRGKPAKVRCVVSFTAPRGSRSLKAKLMRVSRVYASRRIVVRSGRGRVALRLRRDVPRGRYVLRLTFHDAKGKATVIEQGVTIRRHIFGVAGL